MQVAELRHEEPVRLDMHRLKEIFAQMGFQNGENMICGAMEDLAVLLKAATKVWRRGDLDALGQKARKISGLAEQIGMTTLSAVACDVAVICARYDDAALGATVARMTRLGERSLIAIWESHDVSL